MPISGAVDVLLAYAAQRALIHVQILPLHGFQLLPLLAGIAPRLLRPLQRSYELIQKLWENGTFGYGTIPGLGAPSDRLCFCLG